METGFSPFFYSEIPLALAKIHKFEYAKNIFISTNYK